MLGIDQGSNSLADVEQLSSTKLSTIPTYSFVGLVSY